MEQFHLDLQTAMDWVGRYHEKIREKFIDGLHRIPSWGSTIDEQVAEYVHALANWVRANHCWNFEGGRYFGSSGPQYKKTGRVQLLSKCVRDKELHGEDVIIPMIDEL